MFVRNKCHNRVRQQLLHIKHHKRRTFDNFLEGGSVPLKLGCDRIYCTYFQKTFKMAARSRMPTKKSVPSRPVPSRPVPSVPSVRMSMLAFILVFILYRRKLVVLPSS